MLVSSSLFAKAVSKCMGVKESKTGYIERRQGYLLLVLYVVYLVVITQ